MTGRILPLILCTVILAFRDQTLVRATTFSQDTIISVPSRQLIGRGKTGHHIVQRDIARAQTLFIGGGGEPLKSPSLPPDVPNDDEGLFGVVMDIQIGNGSYAVQVDSGSSNLWIGANASNPYRPSGQSRDIGKNFNVTYGSGNVTGRLFSDLMGLPGVPSLFNQTFGVAINESSQFEGFDGLLGIGPKNLTLLSVQPHELISTPTDNMLTEQIIHHNITAAFIPPVTLNLPGRFDFGGTSTKGLTTPINYVPNLEAKDSPLSHFYSVNQTIKYGEGENGTIILQGAGIMDTGSTLLGLTNASFQSYMQVTNAVKDDDTGFLRVDDPKNLQSLFFQIGETLYEFTPEAQIWPREHNIDIGGKSNATYLIVDNLGDLSLDSNFPANFSINGMYWMSQYYVVFDSSGPRRVGIAETIYNFSNIKNKNKK